MAGGRRGGGERRDRGQIAGGVAIDEAGVGSGQRWQRLAVSLALVVGGDRQRRRGDIQRAG
jgi:hypothetical protein